MQKYTNVFQDTLGRIITGATVTVTVNGSGAAATLYSDNGVTQLPNNTTTTDTLGAFYFYAADGRYDVALSKTGVTTETLRDILLFDPAASTGSAGVGTIQSGTGALATTVQAKLREQWFSITDFGASTSATAAANVIAINAAITAANAAGGGVVFVPDAHGGSYAITDGGVVFKSNVWMIGQGKGSKFTTPGYGIGIRDTVVNNCAVIGINVTSSATGYLDKWLIYFYINSSSDPTNVGGTGIKIIGCYAINGSGNAIMVSTYSDVDILDNHIEQAGENGIEVQSFFDATFMCKRVRVSGNTLKGWAHWSSGTGIVVFGRHEELNVLDNITDANSEASAARGILFDGSNFSTVTVGAAGLCAGNTVIGSGTGIQDLTACRMLVTANRIKDATTQAINKLNAEYRGNFITQTTLYNAFSSTVKTLNPELFHDNIVNTSLLPTTYNWVDNGGFAMFSQGNALVPDYWSDAVGDGSGSATWTSIGQSASVPPVGEFACQIVAAGTGAALLRQFFTISNVKGHMLFVTAWVLCNAASKCRISVRTSGGDFYSNYAATGGTAFVPVSLAVWVDTTDAQASVRLETAASATAHWAGVSATIDSPNGYASDHKTKVLPVLTAVPLDTPVTGTTVITSVAGTYKIQAYIAGVGWKGAALT